jgi:hypothetical protein
LKQQLGVLWGLVSLKQEVALVVGEWQKYSVEVHRPALSFDGDAEANADGGLVEN